VGVLGWIVVGFVAGAFARALTGTGGCFGGPDWEHAAKNSSIAAKIRRVRKGFLIDGLRWAGASARSNRS
jgi:hypothetical protein